MRLYLICIYLVLFSFCSYAQEQPFRTGFRFSPYLLNTPKGDSLFLIQERTQKVISQVGYLERSGERILSETDSTFLLYMHKKNPKDDKALTGIIKERNKDSLFILFWPFKRKAISKGPGFVNPNDEDSLFVLKINKWDKSPVGHWIKDIPYANTQITAVNFPIRVNLSDGSVETGFTNAAISVTRIRGQARLYKSALLEPRYRYWGYGFMFGVGARKDMNDKDEFSINYGLSLIGSMYGVKLIVAAGLENGFKSTSKKLAPFVGLGFGLDIYSVVNPEIKKKEE